MLKNYNNLSLALFFSCFFLHSFFLKKSTLTLYCRSTQHKVIINMEDVDFPARKRAILRELNNGEIDRSPKGFVDDRCLPVIELLNKLDNYVTTSSCSGRVSLWISKDDSNENEEHQDSKKKSQGGSWLWITHDEPVMEDALTAMEKVGNNDSVWLKFEPYILHVQASSLHHAKQLLTAGLNSGFRNSGIVPAGTASHPSYIVAIRHTARLDCPVQVPGAVPYSPSTLRYLITTSTDKIKSTWERADMLLTALHVMIEKLNKELTPKEDPKDKWKRRHEEGLRKQREAKEKQKQKQKSSEAEVEGFDGELDFNAGS